MTQTDMCSTHRVNILTSWHSYKQPGKALVSKTPAKSHLITATRHTSSSHRTSPRHTSSSHRTSPRHTSSHRTSPRHTSSPHRTSPRHTSSSHRTSPRHTSSPHRTSPRHTSSSHRTSPRHTSSPHRTSPRHTSSHRTSPRHTRRADPPTNQQPRKRWRCKVASSPGRAHCKPVVSALKPAGLVTNNITGY